MRPLSSTACLWRLRATALGMVTAGALLAAGLWRVQVEGGEVYEQDLARQSIRRIRTPGMRGRLYDRHGLLLADNRPSYDIVLFLEELRRPGPWDRTIQAVQQALTETASKIGRPPDIGEDEIRAHIRRRLPLPLTAWRDLDEEVLARWAERASGTRGLDLHIEAVRMYPRGGLAAHLLGTVGRADPGREEEAEPFHFYLPEIEGKTGLERQFDTLLRGRAGGRLVRVDVSGYRHADLGGVDPVPGDDLLLALDARAQELAEAALSGYRGAAVVLDPRNGEVLAAASAPAFDPNLFIPRLSPGVWRALLNDPGKPLLDRVTGGQYPPGSTFKPVVALAALEMPGYSPETRWSCPGWFRLGSHTFHCWQRSGHGALTLGEALQHSCNVYFYHLGLKIGPAPILDLSARLGLGRATGIELPYEASGLLPDDDWKRGFMGEGWRDGDTCNLTIGQGFLTVTPLQMAVVTAALANGGHVYRPRLVLGRRAPEETLFRLSAPERVRTLSWPSSGLRAVRGGMRAAAMHPGGTARHALVPGWEMAGKTGTAEYGPKGSGLKYAWVLAFAPFDHPRFAAVILIEEGQSGGVTAAPLMRGLMDGLLNPRKENGEVSG